MLDPRLFRLAGVRSGALGIVALFFALFGLFDINAQYMQDVKGYSALLTGVAVLPVVIVMPFTSARSTHLAARIGARATIVGGMLILTAGNSTTREFGSALGEAVFSTILTARFASHLPATLARVPGAQGQAIRHSITSALHYAAATPDPAVRAHLISGTRDAFTSGTSLGLRVGAVLLLATTAVVAYQHPREQEP